MQLILKLYFKKNYSTKFKIYNKNKLSIIKKKLSLL